MRILGVDPGTATTGFAVVERSPSGLSALDYGVITTSKRLDLPERLLEIVDNLREIMDMYKPDLAVVESLFFCKNQKTAIDVAQARGAIVYTLAFAEVKVCELTPLQVKQAITGYGKADKKQVQALVQNIYGLKAPPRPDDAADALALAFAITPELL